MKAFTIILVALFGVFLGFLMALYFIRSEIDRSIKENPVQGYMETSR